MLETAGVDVLPDLPRFLAFAMVGSALNMIPSSS